MSHLNQFQCKGQLRKQLVIAGFQPDSALRRRVLHYLANCDRAPTGKLGPVAKPNKIIRMATCPDNKLFVLLVLRLLEILGPARYEKPDVDGKLDGPIGAGNIVILP
ncbi:hypothetical protein An13g03390 [Aspergillus niger]|uniref:Uncharacterized protein n=2 Tax=Aspergillus niger TaxID=5061 RepID=A2R235_ASPNC|nr:hypothetical protein An13g03390 [Aspergillus niger]CAK41735.1 hypothetical protein An13g03390 [Aspergillus niger]